MEMVLTKLSPCIMVSLRNMLFHIFLITETNYVIEFKLKAWPIMLLFIADDVLWQCLLQNMSHISKESLTLIQDSVKTSIFILTYSMKMFGITVSN